ncbi:DUF1127 domain-containing protein [Salaquimonas pukyongi]|uniref:DUF1127 domain-containing protein n=1 Tax=Salaquimonas pukyongi TaxID=2712698 RepID=UPI00096BAB13|nr:DUF1127 domain-containing protein [Salaquimonas pukyongi]
MMHQQPKQISVSPLLLSVLSTSLNLLVDRDEMEQAVNGHMAEIRRLSAMSDKELSAIGITRDQIVAYVLHESVEL